MRRCDHGNFHIQHQTDRKKKYQIDVKPAQHKEWGLASYDVIYGYY